MKKIILSILVTFLISTSIGVNTPYAIAQGIGTADDAEAAEADTVKTETPKDENKTFIPTVIIKPESLPGPTGGQDRGSLVSGILPRLGIGLIGFVGLASLAFLLIGGIRFATAYGNEESIEKAKDQIIYAIAGFILALLSYTIVIIVNNLFLDSPTNTPAPNPPSVVYEIDSRS